MQFFFKKNIFIGLVFILLSYVLARRDIYLAQDDSSYINYFSGIFFISDDFSNIIVEEPLWNLYSLLLGSLFTPEFSIKITIFISTFLFLTSSFILCNRKWFFLILYFIFTYQLSTQLYFNQIRQGFALSIFLYGLSKDFKLGLLFSFIATLIHTSFAFISIIYLFSFLTLKNRNLYILSLLLTAFSLLIVFLTKNNFSYIIEFTGRRSEVVEFEQKLNINFFIIFLPQFIYILFYSKKYLHNHSERFTWRFIYFFILFINIISLGFDIGRLIYFCFIFIPILILKSLTTRSSFILALYWLFFNFSFNLYQYYKDFPIVLDTLFGRWIMILQ